MPGYSRYTRRMVCNDPLIRNHDGVLLLWNDYLFAQSENHNQPGLYKVLLTGQGYRKRTKKQKSSSGAKLDNFRINCKSNNIAFDVNIHCVGSVIV